MSQHDVRLATKIKARNLAGEIANKLHPQFLAVFQQFAGKKVCKADGTLTKKVSDMLPPLEGLTQESVHYWCNNSRYSVSFTIKTCQLDGQGHCEYESVSVYVCDLEDGYVKAEGRWYEAANFRTDYTLAEVLKLREDYKTKQKIADEAKSKLYPFGEYDN